MGLYAFIGANVLDKAQALTISSKMGGINNYATNFYLCSTSLLLAAYLCSFAKRFSTSFFSQSSPKKLNHSNALIACEMTKNPQPKAG